MSFCKGTLASSQFLSDINLLARSVSTQKFGAPVWVPLPVSTGRVEFAGATEGVGAFVEAGASGSNRSASRSAARADARPFGFSQSRPGAIFPAFAKGLAGKMAPG